MPAFRDGSETARAPPPEPKKPAWGEEGDDDGDLPDFPTRHETEPDVNGVKTVTTYRTDEDTGQKFKVVRVVKVTKKTTKVHKSVLERRKWSKFGQFKENAAGYHGPGFTDGFTTLDASDQTLEMTPKARVQEENNESAQRAFEKMNVGAFEAWRPKTRTDAAAGAAEWAAANGLVPREGEGLSGLGGGAGGGGLAALAAAQDAKLGGGAGGYVPPSMRNADGTRNAALAGVGSERDDSCTVRVSNLSEDVKDSDLRELFRRFGAIQRIYLAKDRETQQSRGFAFINFFHKEDAASAIAKLDGHGYDHLILSVSWANPAAAPAQTAPETKSTEAFPSLGGRGPPGRGADLYTGVGAAASDARFDKHVFNPGFERFQR